MDLIVGGALYLGTTCWEHYDASKNAEELKQAVSSGRLHIRTLVKNIILLLNFGSSDRLGETERMFHILNKEYDFSEYRRVLEEEEGLPSYLWKATKKNRSFLGFLTERIDVEHS